MKFLYKLFGICSPSFLTLLLTFSTSSLLSHPAYGTYYGEPEGCAPSPYENQPYEEPSATLAGIGYSNIQFNDTANTNYTLSVLTDRSKYVPGDIISISGEVYDEKGCHVAKKVVIQVRPEGSQKSLINTASISDGGFYSNVDLFAEQPGKYTVEVSIDGTAAKASNWFEVTNFFLTTPAYMMYIGIAFLGGLMIIIARGMIINPDVSEILRFLFITGIVFSPIGALVLTDIEVGTNSPVGLVKRSPLDENGQPKCPQTQMSGEAITPGGDWVINVGGTREDCYGEGIQIPINVAIFGIVGGYLRYLWKTAGLRLKRNRETPSRTQENDSKDNIRTWLFFQSLEDLALLFLSPLLAIAVWFVLFQGGTTGEYGIAVISFTVGLITEEVIQTLIRFSGSLLRTTQETRTQVEDTKK